MSDISRNTITFGDMRGQKDGEQGMVGSCVVKCTYTDEIEVYGDLDQAYEWWVKWGKVHVVWKEGQEVEEYGDGGDSMEFWHRPDATEVLTEAVN